MSIYKLYPLSIIASLLAGAFVLTAPSLRRTTRNEINRR